MKRHPYGGVGAGLGGGSLIGLLLSEYGRKVLERLLDILEKQGEFALYSLAVLGVFVWLTYWFGGEIIRSKNAEIDRLADEKKEFQKLFIKRWITSEPTQENSEEGKEI